MTPNNPSLNSAVAPDSALDEIRLTLSQLQRGIRKLEQDAARLEGTIASSWATHTRDEYEKEFKSNVEQDLKAFAAKCFVAAIIFLTGTGYFIINSAVTEKFEKENKAAIETLQKDLSARFEREVRSSTKERDWLRFQSYGTERKRLAEFYEHLKLPEAETMDQQLILMAKAADRFHEATEIDPEQATSYYELGELNYSFPAQLGLPTNEQEAIPHYEDALLHYKPVERERGWKGDCYLNLGKLYASQVKSGAPKRTDDLTKAIDNLTHAKSEYFEAKKTTNRGDINQRLAEIEKLLKELGAMTP